MGGMGGMGSLAPHGLMRWLGETSLQAGVLVILILAVQGLVRGRISARWRHAMWLLLVARLVLPWAPPSRWSVYNLFNPLSRLEPLSLIVPSSGVEGVSLQSSLDNADATPSGGLQSSEVPPSGGIHNSIGPPSGSMNNWERGRPRPLPAMDRQAAPVPESGIPPSATFSESRLQPASPPSITNPPPSLSKGVPATFAFPMSLWLAVIWLAGALAVLGVMMVQSLRLGAIVRRQRPVTHQGTLELLEECKERMGLRAWLVVAESPEMRSPALLGFIRPRLLLPAGAIRALGPERLKHVFLHELAHLKRRDILLNWLIALLQALHWFNPLVWMGFHRMRGDREMACDALALACLQPEETGDYGRTIIDLLDRFARPQAMPGLAGILEDKAQIKRRITMIAQFRKSSFFGSALAAVLMLLVGGMTLTSAAPRGVKASFDRPFVSDPEAVGIWQSVDFVQKIEGFKPGEKSWKGDLYLKGLEFIDGGTTGGPWQWTKGYLWHPGDKAEGKYEIREMDGEKYLFMEWMSGDVTIRGMAPKYYVLKKTGAGEKLTDAQRAMIEKAAREKVFPTAEQAAKIEVGKSTLEDAIKAFGEPLAYVWGNEKFAKDKLPGIFCMQYPRQFLVVVEKGVVSELRHHEPGFVFKGKLQVGSSEDDALQMLGEPAKVVSGQLGWDDGVLYKDREGRTGSDYYSRPVEGVRIFFKDGKISALYQTPEQAMKKASPAAEHHTGVSEGSDDPFANLSAQIKQLQAEIDARLSSPAREQLKAQLELSVAKQRAALNAVRQKLELVRRESRGNTEEMERRLGAAHAEMERKLGFYLSELERMLGATLTQLERKPGNEADKPAGDPAPSLGSQISQTVEGQVRNALSLANEAAGLALEKARTEIRKELAEQGQPAAMREQTAPGRLEAARKALETARAQAKLGICNPDDVAAAEAEVKIAEAEASGDMQTVWKTRLDQVKKELAQKKAGYAIGVIPADEVLQSAEKLQAIPPDAGPIAREAARLRLDVAREFLKVIQNRVAAGRSPADELGKAECEVKIAQLLCDGDLKAATRAELEKARIILKYAQLRFDVGAEPKDKLIRAEAGVKIAQARCDGDALAEARARLEQAERLLELVKAKRSVMVAEQSDVDQAEAEVKACQAALERLSKAKQNAGTEPKHTPAPQLKIESFTLQPYEEGGLYTVTVGIRNTGDAPAPAFDVKFYRNEAERQKPGSNGAGPIKPGETWNEGMMPFALKEGVNRISVVLDRPGVVKERIPSKHAAELEVTVKDGKVVGKKVTIREKGEHSNASSSAEPNH